MPYPTVDDLPDSLRATLPPHAQEIYRGTFNSAWSSYHDRRAAEHEGIAHRIAWAAVKRRYEKRGGRWMAKPEGPAWRSGLGQGRLTTRNSGSG
jgi:cation transport regulator